MPTIKTTLVCLVAANALSASPGIHACGGDGCTEWCGELPNVYFLRPGNDTRANLALILEDLQVLRLPDKDIPFHYSAFAEQDPQAVPTPPADQGQPNLSELAAGVGISPAEFAQDLSRARADAEGRCVSNSAKTVAQFWQVLVEAKDIAAPEKKALAEARLRLLGRCDKLAADWTGPQLASAAAQAYADYLRATAYFYAGKFDDLTKDAAPPPPPPPPEPWAKRLMRSLVEWLADFWGFFGKHASSAPVPPAAPQPPPVTSFKVLATSPQPWVREASTYMLGRVYLNQAQQGFQPYSSQAKPDKARLAQAKEQFKTYLAAYPAGLYAESAQGLFRKIDWLDENYAGLAQAYGGQLDSFRRQVPGNEELLAFIDELESKYPLNRMDEDFAWDKPILASLGTLLVMRSPSPYQAQDIKPVETYLPTALAAHEENYSQAGLAGLHGYLRLAYSFYIERDFAKVVKSSDAFPAEDGLSNVAFSAQVLRGLSLGAQKHWDGAEKLWLELAKHTQKPGHKIQLQWLLALTWREQGRLDKLYAVNSAVSQQSILDVFMGSASPALLEMISKSPRFPELSRRMAGNILWSGLLRHRQYGELSRIVKTSKIPPDNARNALDGEGYACPEVKDIMGGLAKNPKSPALLNCYGVLLDQLYLPSARWPEWEDAGLGVYQLEAYYPAGQAGLKTKADSFGGKTYNSLDLYMEVINLPQAKGEAQAYALHRATNCFATTGSNRCGSQDIPLEQRAAWFRKLKTVYQDTPWAQQQKYYW